LAGKHHLLLIGTPGSGKSLLARASKELVPKINIKDENIFQTQLRDQGLLSNSQTDIENNIHFREPHHTSSYSEIIGNRLIPGEIVLAHGGILFLDELVEFNRRVLEGLRQPMENKYIQKNYLSDDTHAESNANNALIPTDFILIGCMNPCDCGYCFNSNQRKCICTQGQIDKYKRKMNSPLFQRFDMCIYVTNERSRGNTNKNQDQKLLGKTIKANITRVRNIQDREDISDTQKTQITESDLRLNLKNKTQKLLEEICIKNKFSKREEFSLLRVARTIADLAGCESVENEHILEALSYKTNRVTNRVEIFGNSKTKS
jgi:magnesium chelatase family protein